MGPQVPSFQSKDPMFRTGPGAQHKELGMGVGWIQGEGPGIRSQDENATGNPGDKPHQQGQGSRNGAQAEWEVRGGNTAERPVGRGPQEDSWDSGIQGKGNFDGLPTKELLERLRESIS